MDFNTVSVIGLGYIGLPTAAAFAARKIKVIGVDVNPQTVDTINRGEIHIVEPDLDMVVHAAVTEGYLKATTIPESADAFLIAVPTPFKGDNHEPDLKYIKAASKAIAPVLKAGNLVVLESTSPVGTTEKMADWLAEERPDLTFPQTSAENSDIRIAYCPERVLPGRVMRELVENDRVVGGLTHSCSLAAIKLYQFFVVGECISTSARTAEMVKLTENSFRDVNIAFANELSIICEKQSIDVWELISLANRHPRVEILRPGAGVGGHCIAVDPWFIVSQNPEDARLIQTARVVNDSKPDWVIDRVKSACLDVLDMKHGYKPSDLSIACLGLSFKADIDDLRESPALYIAQQLAIQSSGEILLVEPNISKLPDECADMGGELVDLSVALSRADVIVILVDHSHFKNIGNLIPEKKLVIDTRGMLR